MLIYRSMWTSFWTVASFISRSRPRTPKRLEPERQSDTPAAAQTASDRTGRDLRYRYRSPMGRRSQPENLAQRDHPAQAASLRHVAPGWELPLRSGLAPRRRRHRQAAACLRLRCYAKQPSAVLTPPKRRWSISTGRPRPTGAHSGPKRSSQAIPHQTLGYRKRTMGNLPGRLTRSQVHRHQEQLVDVFGSVRTL